MSKFKVGDKVRVRDDADGYYMEPPMKAMRGKIVTISYLDSDDKMQYKIAEFRYWWDESLFEEITTEQPRREFIVIRRSGAETIAELRHDREVIKSAKATCNASDTFDFSTGAKLAFDRLMGREEPKPMPQPAHRFKVGDRVFNEPLGIFGIVERVDEADKVMPYHIMRDNGRYWWATERELSPAPAPEPPKFYTGKVFAEKSTDDFFQKRDGHIFEFIDGYCENATPDQQMGGRFLSFDDLCINANCTVWHEVKSDV